MLKSCVNIPHNTHSIFASHGTDFRSLYLTHWGQDKMAVIFQTTFSNAFSEGKSMYFWFYGCWNLLSRIHMAITPHWLRQRLGFTSMMISSNGNIFCFTVPLWWESTGHRLIPLTKASDAELWCFLWSVPEQTVKQTIETPVIWDVIMLIHIVTSL